ncbi:YceI family protein [Algibacter miyuki]|uniref:YceI family protein n=1 Tax=Algibacter miyuki TaxID=1306933 RepID=A0ABV5GWK1_9FLAO|nr:YceI family protein [Algibacter miyuki]MDN3664262.1 YceI family protein [Algibacter miyuki]
MKTLVTQGKRVLNLFMLFVLTSTLVQAQQLSLVNNESTLTVLGTSNIHDWHLEAESQTGTIKFKNLETCQIEALTLSIEAEGLVSGKKSMDKNTFKALNTEDHKSILFKLVEVKSITNKDAGVYSVNTQGDLTISGVKKRISLNFNISIDGSSVTLVGEKAIKMTDFNVDPPKALFGSITTGDALTIKFSTLFR